MSETGTAAAAPPTSTAVAPAGAPAPSKTGPETVVTDAPTTEAPTEEAYRKAKHRVVLDGKDSEVDYDELVRGYQRAKVGHARLEEAARREKQVQAHSAQVERVLAAMESGDVRIARETFAAKIPLGAICIAPTILAAAGVLAGKKATVWDSEGEQITFLKQCGAEYSGESVTRDGLIVTGNGPKAAEEFGRMFAAIPAA